MVSLMLHGGNMFVEIFLVLFVGLSKESEDVTAHSVLAEKECLKPNYGKGKKGENEDLDGLLITEAVRKDPEIVTPIPRKTLSLGSKGVTPNQKLRLSIQKEASLNTEAVIPEAEKSLQSLDKNEERSKLKQEKVLRKVRKEKHDAWCRRLSAPHCSRVAESVEKNPFPSRNSNETELCRQRGLKNMNDSDPGRCIGASKYRGFKRPAGDDLSRFEISSADYGSGSAVSKKFDLENLNCSSEMDRLRYKNLRWPRVEDPLNINTFNTKNSPLAIKEPGCATSSPLRSEKPVYSTAEGNSEICLRGYAASNLNGEVLSSMFEEISREEQPERSFLKMMRRIIVWPVTLGREFESFPFYRDNGHGYQASVDSFMRLLRGMGVIIISIDNVPGDAVESNPCIGSLTFSNNESERVFASNDTSLPGSPLMSLQAPENVVEISIYDHADDSVAEVLPEQRFSASSSDRVDCNISVGNGLTVEAVTEHCVTAQGRIDCDIAVKNASKTEFVTDQRVCTSLSLPYSPKTSLQFPENVIESSNCAPRDCSTAEVVSEQGVSSVHTDNISCNPDVERVKDGRKQEVKKSKNVFSPSSSFDSTSSSYYSSRRFHDRNKFRRRKVNSCQRSECERKGEKYCSEVEASEIKNDKSKTGHCEQMEPFEIFFAILFSVFVILFLVFVALAVFDKVYGDDAVL